MTREEAIAHGKEQLEVFGGEHRKFIEMAIKSLEQEPILDKIRAEIIELRSKQNVGVLECLDIIDKYKAESEPQESEDDE